MLKRYFFTCRQAVVLVFMALSPKVYGDVPLDCDSVQKSSFEMLEDLKADDSAVCRGIEPELFKENCEKILVSGKVPKDAFIWTVKVYKNNLGHLNTRRCLGPMPLRHYSLKGFNPATLNGGIRNRGQFIINDTRTRHGGKPYRGHMYYIDLEKGEIIQSYFNMGVGSFDNKFANQPGKKTTLLGAFLTTDKEFSYELCDERDEISGRCLKWREEYIELRDQYFKGEDIEVPAVALIGLQKSNNRSAEDLKYMHVSPYQSSWGCPSISAELEKKYRIIRKMAERGPSLVVNYGYQMEDPAECSENWSDQWDFLF